MDGAFYAGPEEEVEEGEETDPEAEHFHSILVRYEALRQRLDQTPPLEVLQKLDKEAPIYLGHLNSAKVKWWRWKLRTTDPLPAQLAAMDKDTVLGLLKLLGGGNLLQRGADVNLYVTRWIWSLLAKLPDRGALNSEEIGIIRELGKRAVLVGVGLREGNKWDKGMQEVEAGYDAEDHEESWDEAGEDGDLEDDIVDEILVTDVTSSDLAPLHVESTSGEAAYAQAEKPTDMDELALAKARMLGLLRPATDDTITQVETIEFAQEITADETANLSEAPPHVAYESSTVSKASGSQYNSMATVDMILTIAGEMYGQRDLLEFRGGWSV